MRELSYPGRSNVLSQNGMAATSNPLSSIEAINCIVIFDEETPLELIKLVKPDILVKGGDWSKEQIVGSSFVLSYGGEVESLTFVQGHSMTKLIQDLQGRQ